MLCLPCTPALLQSLRPLLAGKIIIDATNPYYSGSGLPVPVRPFRSCFSVLSQVDARCLSGPQRKLCSRISPQQAVIHHLHFRPSPFIPLATFCAVNNSRCSLSDDTIRWTVGCASSARKPLSKAAAFLRSPQVQRRDVDQDTAWRQRCVV